MQLSSVAAKAALKIAVCVGLLAVGIGGGAALGLLKGPAVAEAALMSPADNHIASFVPADQFASAGLTVQEAPPAPVAVKTVRRVITQAAPRSTGSSAVGVPALTLNIPGTAGTAGAAKAPCTTATLDDKKINWLLNLVSKAKASNPDQAAVADRVDGQLRSAMGQNMCADEAQIHISNMCADGSTKKFMALMVKELPFFVRPLVGDPCTKDLVSAAEKYL